MPLCKVILTDSSQIFSHQEHGALSYSIPEHLNNKIFPGLFVQVPFIKQKKIALVLEVLEKQLEESKYKLRDIEDIVNTTHKLPTDLQALIKFTADYYACSYSEVLDAASINKTIPKAEKIITLNNQELQENKLSEDQLIVLSALSRARQNTAKWSRLKTLSGFKEDRLKSLVLELEKKSCINIKYEIKEQKLRKKVNPFDEIESEKKQAVTYTQEQQQALKQIDINTTNKYLIHGVTGSGKTEVYFNLIWQCLNKKQNIIFLIPEISLAPQLSERLAQKFPQQEIIIWHSALSLSERNYALENIFKPEPKIILGARSAILSPVDNLGLIVIDEEHENSYKQDTSPRYSAIKLAEKRAELNSCPLILGSATPNIENYYKAQNNIDNYSLVTLKKRILDIPLPEVKMADMREEFNHGNKTVFAKALKARIEKSLENNQQSILFLNKRGSASYVFCRNCGFTYNCPNCDAKINYHADKKLLICHHCAYQEEHPKECPNCQSPAIKFFGLGTQKLEEETKRAFPHARVARLDSDVSRQGKYYQKIWQELKKGEIDILIGTQMIAKGLDLPKLTTVGVISADSNFIQLDYKADERGFQLLTQVAGRAGRAEDAGEVIFQTYQTEKDAIKFASEHNFEDFYEHEIKLRKSFHYPPFGSVIRFVSSSEEDIKALDAIDNFYDLLIKNIQTKYPDKKLIAEPEETDANKINLMGPCPPVVSKLNRKYRYHLIVKIPNDIAEIKTCIIDSYYAFKEKCKSTFIIDVDNINLN